MAVIVYNKNTGKYLKKHSGSFNHLCRKTDYNSKFREEIKTKFGEEAARWGSPIRKKNIEEIKKIMENYVFNAAPEEAHVYHSAAGVKNSIGRWQSKIEGKVIPAYLEIHEIKESFVCIMRPDGSSNCDEEK